VTKRCRSLADSSGKIFSFVISLCHSGGPSLAKKKS